jgi:hypothetical protein
MMAGTWTSERFPQFERPLRELIRQHKEIKDEPLHLAISYASPRDPQDIFLLEVAGGLWAERSAERELFEVTFTATSGFPMEPDQLLHLVLSTPEEIAVALHEGWPSAKDVVGAIRDGDYKVLHADVTGKKILRLIKSHRSRGRKASRG